jgi:hypothetical protein
LITAQEVTGLNPVEVTNEYTNNKKRQVSLERFFVLCILKASLLLDVAEQNPIY